MEDRWVPKQVLLLVGPPPGLPVPHTRTRGASSPHTVSKAAARHSPTHCCRPCLQGTLLMLNWRDDRDGVWRQMLYWVSVGVPRRSHRVPVALSSVASAGRKPPLESLCSIPASPRPFESLQIRTIVAMRGRPWPIMPVMLVTCYSIMTALIARAIYGTLSTTALSPMENMNINNVISYMGLCVFLLLAFRNNSSYGRWIEGAQKWHEVTASLHGVPASLLSADAMPPQPAHSVFQRSPSHTCIRS